MMTEHDTGILEVPPEQDDGWFESIVQNASGAPIVDGSKRAEARADGFGKGPGAHHVTDARAFALTHDLDKGRNLKRFFELMDDQFAVIQSGSKVLISQRRVMREIVIIGGNKLPYTRVSVELLQKADFLILMENVQCTIKGDDGKERKTAAGAIWLKRKERREYKAVRFLPGIEGDPNTLNTFAGWAVTPRLGDWSLLRGHILENLCAGDSELFKFCLAWLASIFQHPATKPGTALVFKGLKGTGKTKLAEWMVYLCGAAAIILDKADQLTGRFNGHLDDKILVVADEASWGGDKASVGALNSLITGRSLTLERKHADITDVPSFHRVIILGNNDWIVPATKDERRFAVFDVGDGRRKDRAFFAAIDKQMANGGAEAMLQELLTMEINCDVGRAPITDGLGQQVAQGMTAIDRLLVRLATEGCIRDRAGNIATQLDEDEPTKWDKSKFMDCVASAYPHRYPQREVGVALKSVGILTRRWRQGGSREKVLLFPSIKALTASLEASFDMSIEMLSGSTFEDAADE